MFKFLSNLLLLAHHNLRLPLPHQAGRLGQFCPCCSHLAASVASKYVVDQGGLLRFLGT